MAVETATEEIRTIEDLDAIHESPEIKRLESLFELIDDKDVLREWRGRLSKLKADKRDGLKQNERAAEDKERQRERDFTDSILEDLRFVDDDLDGITEEAAIDNYQKKSPLAARVLKKAHQLPQEARDEILGSLGRIFQERKKELKNQEKIQDKSTNRAFGFPIFVPEEPRIIASVKPSGRNAKIGTLVFKDHLGNEWMPNVGNLPVDPNDTETREAIELYREDARYALFGENKEKVRSLVPVINKEWVIHEETEENLKRMGRLLDKQMRRQNGILILVGEAGTGKNVLADIFGHYTNREVFEFSCNKQTEKEDVQFSYEYDADKGTVKIPSNVINALQTPGAIIAFDEINTLPPGVAKLLNPLFDHRRKLILPDGRIIKAHPTVTIVGFMNPENYRGTSPLPQEVKSRARMIPIEYPKVRANEALMYAPLTKSLKGLSSEEFKVLWGKIVDGTPSDIADKVDSEERATTLRNLNEMIRIANLMRGNYRQTQTGLAAHDAEVNFIFSLRDGGQVMEELDDDSALTVKEAMKDVIIAKISEPEEKTTVTTLIDNA